MEKGKRVIYFDGSCSLCSALKHTIEASSQRDKFTTIDITRNRIIHNFTKEQLMKEIYIVGENGKTYKNVDAIAKVLEVYPQFTLLASISRLPAIKQLLWVVYKFVSTHRYYFNTQSSVSRIYWLKITLSFALLSGFLLSYKLWISTRAYPLTPLLNSLPQVQFPFDYILLVAMIFSLGTIILLPRPKRLILILIALATFLAILDQSRWQPWFYQYMFMFICLSFYSWREQDASKAEKILNACRFIVASVYFWSGVNKLNPYFPDTTFYMIIYPLTNLFSNLKEILPSFFWITIPLYEILVGVFLLTRFKNIALWAAFLMHVYLLVLYGPFGSNSNTVIWPWNIAMIFFIIILFLGTKKGAVHEVLNAHRFPFFYVIFFLFGVMPLFNLFGRWESYLSFTLYTNNINYAGISIHKGVVAKLPSQIQESIRISPAKNARYDNLDLHTWSYKELNVPAYPEARVFKNIARDLCHYAQKPTDIILHITERKGIIYPSPRKSEYTCSEL